MLSPEQIHIQVLFKAFIVAIMKDAAKFVEGPVQIKTDLHLGTIKQCVDKATEYGIIMNEILGITKDIQQEEFIPKESSNKILVSPPKLKGSDKIIMDPI